MIMYRLLLLFALIISSSCKGTDGDKLDVANPETVKAEFDQQKWQKKIGMDYEHRDEMLNRLIESDTLKKLKKPDILAMLGEPDRIDNNHLFYTISRKRLQFVTLHTRTMVIKLRSDESVEWVKIHE